MPNHPQWPLVTRLRVACHLDQLLSKHLENELWHICSQIAQQLPLVMTIVFRLLLSDLFLGEQSRIKRILHFDSRIRLFIAEFNFPIKSAAFDFFLIWWIIPNKWWVLAVGASTGFLKSSKCGLPTSQIGIFGARPKNLRPGLNPSNCRTSEFKCIINISENPPFFPTRTIRLLIANHMINDYSEMSAPTFWRP